MKIDDSPGDLEKSCVVSNEFPNISVALENVPQLRPNEGQHAMLNKDGGAKAVDVPSCLLSVHWYHQASFV